MNAKNEIPNRSNGGRFFYDAEGNFVSHEKPTANAAPVHAPATQAAPKPAAAESAAAGKRGK